MPPGTLRSRSLIRFTIRVGLPHLGQSVLLDVSIIFLRSAVLAILAMIQYSPVEGLGAVVGQVVPLLLFYTEARLEAARQNIGEISHLPSSASARIVIFPFWQFWQFRLFWQSRCW